MTGSLLNPGVMGKQQHKNNNKQSLNVTGPEGGVALNSVLLLRAIWLHWEVVFNESRRQSYDMVIKPADLGRSLLFITASQWTLRGLQSSVCGTVSELVGHMGSEDTLQYRHKELPFRVSGSDRLDGLLLCWVTEAEVLPWAQEVTQCAYKVPGILLVQILICHHSTFNVNSIAF